MLPKRTNLSPFSVRDAGDDFFNRHIAPQLTVIGIAIPSVFHGLEPNIFKFELDQTQKSQTLIEVRL